MPNLLPSRGGSLSIKLRDKAALLAASPAPTCEVDITDLACEYAPAGAEGEIVRVTVAGLAWGTTKVEVSLNAPGSGPLAGQTVNVASHQWSTNFDVSATPIPLGGVAQVSVKAAGPGNCNATAKDWVSLGLEDSGITPDLASCRAGFEPGRNRFVAGYADRFVRTRFFTPLVCSNFEVTLSSKTHLVRAMSKAGMTRREADVRVREFAETIRTVGRKLVPHLSERLSITQLGGKVRDAIATAAKSLEPVKSASAKRKGRRTVASRSAASVSDATLVKAKLATGINMATVQPRQRGRQEQASYSEPYTGLQGTVGSTYGTNIGVSSGIEQYALGGWLGILFYDRLRFRPSGIVAGEHVYSLALAPGEEATLTQRSETKRSKSFEDVLDRTTETELEFSSTWSTDVSQQNTNSETSSVGGNLGVSVGAQIEVVNVGVNGGVSASSSNTDSATTQRSRTRQVTARFAAKAREQHKTTFKVSTDLTEEFGSKRVLRNPNPSRALTLNFYKLYAKERVLLERYDAKLALAVCLVDPGQGLRADLEEELGKLDPKVPPGACPAIPTGATTSETKLIVNLNAANWGGDEWGREEFDFLLPSGTVLSNWKFELTDWIFDDGSGNQSHADPATFAQFGGQWNFDSPPAIGMGGGMATTVNVLMPEAFGPGWWTVSVTGRMTWSYVPSDTITGDVQACMEAQKAKIKDSFSADRVMQILEEVKSWERELVFQRMFETVLLRDYFKLGTNPPCAVLELVRNVFDWNEAAIEYIPWWMTPTGRANREHLRQVLLALPGDTRSDLIIDDKLIASAARIYLPIRPGLEDEALAFLLGVNSITGTALDACVRDFINWREANVGPLPFTLPTYDTVLEIGPPKATPAGSDDWDYDWERARNKFLVLDEWSETLPTDGVHLEPALSTCGSTDEYRASALRSDLQSAEARRELDESRAMLEESLAANPAAATTVVIGDPGGRLP